MDLDKDEFITDDGIVDILKMKVIQDGRNDFQNLHDQLKYNHRSAYCIFSLEFPFE